MRIILVDDHAIVREGVRAVLEGHPDLQVVAEFGTGAEAIAMAPRLSPDLALVDLKMPGLSAPDTIAGLRAAVPGIRVLVFTSFGEDALIRATLDAGAIGFLLKDALQSDLVRAIRSVAAGEAFLAPAAQRQLMDLLRKPKNEREALTVRESDVLRLIAEGLSNKQIARRLNLTEGTVKGYVSQILAKLHLDDRTQAALYAVRQGIVGTAS
jgi:DNA-binding NarL/FixJ family response regulator